MIILGIDPGSVCTGYGVIQCTGDRYVVIAHGVIDSQGAHAERLKVIYDHLTRIIKEYAPTMCALEMPIYAQNAQAMLKLGRAQAAAMLAAIHQGLTVAQYSPKEVKRAVTGSGAAHKEQVAYMVGSLLGLPGESLTSDESDALAVALCHQHRHVSGHVSSSPSNWAAFVRQNPHRTR